MANIKKEIREEIEEGAIEETLEIIGQDKLLWVCMKTLQMNEKLKEN
ncbi:hypothetical protein LCGC14_1518820 [marine sediment metagenome]|uniref:Uncharacterized protein n=1 Tax=marine sediment metagenome TaxID=412755 RepID=A0A0F9IZ89_9ZZZZ